MATQLKNMLIGLFVMIAAFLIVGIILFIKPSVGDGGQILKVRFSNIAGLQIGTRVTLAGKPIGEVVAIHQVPDARLKTVSEYGQVYPFVLTLRIDSSVAVFSTDEITVQTQGLLGEKYIAIIPHYQSPNTPVHVLTDKDVVYAHSTDLFESAVNEFASLSEKFEETLDKVIQWMDKYGDDVGHTVQAIEMTTSEIGKAVETINQQRLIEEIRIAASNFASTFANIDQMTFQLDQGGFINNLNQTMATINQISSSIASGRGTLGQLLVNDSIYLDVNAVLGKVNTLMNDINSYGILFQYNKTWQRMRLARMNRINALKDPKAFTAQMNEEIDSLSTTISKMAEMTGRIDSQSVVTNICFKKAFYQLMKQIESLEDQIKLYNQKLYDMTQDETCRSQCKAN